MIIYTCDTCKKTSMRSTDGWELECSCGGTMVTPTDKPSKGQYNYACTACGNQWGEPTDRAKVCTKCNSTDIVIQYDDINVELYNDIQKNIADNKRYTWQCLCGGTKELYSNKIFNVSCSNGCAELMQYMPDANILEKLKEHRKKKRWTQAEMAKRYKVSQSYYAMIESGKKPIPLLMMKLITDL